MSSPTPPPLSDASPNTIEILWETHRKKVQAVVVLLCVCLVGFYGLQYYQQSQIDAEWSRFAAATGLDRGYTAGPESTGLPLAEDLIVALESKDLAVLDAELAKATPSQKPYVLWLVANRAVQLKEWQRAESALAQLEADYPKHPLVVATPYPVQVRKPVKTDDEEEDAARPKPKEPELLPAKEGSMVGLLRARIAALQQFEPPAQFQKPEIPTDAPKYRIKFAGPGVPGNGEVVIALMTQQAPELTKEFEKLAAEDFWKDIKVDEIQRPPAAAGRFANTLCQFHFGFASTRGEDRSQWDTTKPSEHLVDENTGLSHFPGAVAARLDADGKSQVDRLWIVGDDAAAQDGTRQVFAYVVEGMDVVKGICKDLPLSSAQEDQVGRGKPADNIKIESITKV